MNESRGRSVNPVALARASGFSHGVLYPPQAGAMLFVAGQIGWDRHGKFTTEDFTGQFEQALLNVLEVVRTAGGAPDSIGRMAIYVTDRATYMAARPALVDVWRRHMGRHFPAMSLVAVSALVEPQAQVEIEAIAVVPYERTVLSERPDDASNLPV